MSCLVDTPTKYGRSPTGTRVCVCVARYWYQPVLTSRCLVPGTSRYYGDSKSMVYTFQDGELQTFAARDCAGSSANEYYQLANPDALAMGGGGHFAFFLEADLDAGTTGACDTFASPLLTGDEDFDVAGVELWAVQWA